MSQTSPKKLQNFMNNIAAGLKSHNIDDLNEAIKGVIVNNYPRKDEIDYLLTIIANGYSISKRTLKVARATGEIKEARNIAYCILHIHLKLSSRHIAIKVFGHKAHNAVWEAINNFNTLNEKIKTDRIFKEKYDVYHGKLVEFIKQKES